MKPAEEDLEIFGSTPISQISGGFMIGDPPVAAGGTSTPPSRVTVDLTTERRDFRALNAMAPPGLCTGLPPSSAGAGQSRQGGGHQADSNATPQWQHDGVHGIPTVIRNEFRSSKAFTASANSALPATIPFGGGPSFLQEGAQRNPSMEQGT